MHQLAAPFHLLLPLTWLALCALVSPPDSPSTLRLLLHKPFHTTPQSETDPAALLARAPQKDVMQAIRALSLALNAVEPVAELAPPPQAVGAPGLPQLDRLVAHAALCNAHAAARRHGSRPTESLGRTFLQAALPAVRARLLATPERAQDHAPPQAALSQAAAHGVSCADGAAGEASETAETRAVTQAAERGDIMPALLAFVQSTLVETGSLYWRSDFLSSVGAGGVARSVAASERAAAAESELRAAMAGASAAAVETSDDGAAAPPAATTLAEDDDDKEHRSSSLQ